MTVPSLFNTLDTFVNKAAEAVVRVLLNGNLENLYAELTMSGINARVGVEVQAMSFTV
jgi:hypothetical protein